MLAGLDRAMLDANGRKLLELVTSRTVIHLAPHVNSRDSANVHELGAVRCDQLIRFAGDLQDRLDAGKILGNLAFNRVRLFGSHAFYFDDEKSRRHVLKLNLLNFLLNPQAHALSWPLPDYLSALRCAVPG